MIKRTIIIEEPQVIDKYIEFLKSKSGHALLAALMCVLQVVTTVLYFESQLVQIGRNEFIGFGLGILFAIGLEFGILFTAVNGYRWQSWFLCVLSICIAFGTFGKLFQIETLLITDSLIPFILSGFPPFFIALVSHKLADKYKYEELANQQLHKANTSHLNGSETAYKVLNGSVPK